MKKLRIGEKVIEIDEKRIQPLTDDELDGTCGGTDSENTVYRLVCDICGFKSGWWRGNRSKEWLMRIHLQRCDRELRLESKDSDSNQMTD